MFVSLKQLESLHGEIVPKGVLALSPSDKLSADNFLPVTEHIQSVGFGRLSTMLRITVFLILA
jgi:hypothetical protein